MSSKSTFGDNLTLLALSREHNCQFIVINSRGSSYNQLISISGVYDDELHTFQLGFYPEIHYVSLRIESRAAFERIINGLRNTSRNQGDEQMPYSGSRLRSQREEAISDSPREENLSNVGGFDELEPMNSPRSTKNNTSVDNEDMDHTEKELADDEACEISDEPIQDLEDSEEVQSERGEDISATSRLLNADPADYYDGNIEIQREQRAPGRDDKNLIDENTEARGTRGTPVLPDLVLIQIIKTSIRLHPMMRYTLQRVCQFFERVVQSYGYPCIYIRPSAAFDIRRVSSVARLSRTYGSHSGLMLGLRHILRDSGGRWYRAWLTLQDVGQGWYEVRDVTWR